MGSWLWKSVPELKSGSDTFKSLRKQDQPAKWVVRDYLDTDGLRTVLGSEVVHTEAKDVSLAFEYTSRPYTLPRGRQISSSSFRKACMVGVRPPILEAILVGTMTAHFDQSSSCEDYALRSDGI